MSLGPRLAAGRLAALSSTAKEGDGVLGDLIEDRGALAPLDAACDRLLKEQLDAVLNSLTGRERRSARGRAAAAGHAHVRT